MLKDLEFERTPSMCYKNNTLLKAMGIAIPITEEHEEEIKKCASDVIYFIKNYVKIITLDNGPQLFNLHEYQRKWIETCANNRFVIGKWSRQSGKCVTYDTMITVRNKNTNKVETIPIGVFHERIKALRTN